PSSTACRPPSWTSAPRPPLASTSTAKSPSSSATPPTAPPPRRSTAGPIPLDWLATYTFPLEASFASLDRAAHVYRRLVSRTLAHGTTTAAYYATIHVPATNLLADVGPAH